MKPIQVIRVKFPQTQNGSNTSRLLIWLKVPLTRTLGLVEGYSDKDSGSRWSFLQISDLVSGCG